MCKISVTQSFPSFLAGFVVGILIGYVATSSKTKPPHPDLLKSEITSALRDIVRIEYVVVNDDVDNASCERIGPVVLESKDDIERVAAFAHEPYEVELATDPLRTAYNRTIVSARFIKAKTYDEVCVYFAPSGYIYYRGAHNIRITPHTSSSLRFLTDAAMERSSAYPTLRSRGTRTEE